MCTYAFVVARYGTILLSIAVCVCFLDELIISMVNVCCSIKPYCEYRKADVCNCYTSKKPVNEIFDLRTVLVQGIKSTTHIWILWLFL